MFNIKCPNVVSALPPNPHNVNLLSASVFAIGKERLLSFSVRLSQQSNTVLLKRGRQRAPPPPPRVPVYSPDTVEVVPCGQQSAKKHWACSGPGLDADVNLSRVLGKSVVCPPSFPPSRGVHQAWLPMVSSNKTRPRSPTAPSLFSRAMLSLGMTTWARSLVMREIS